MGMTGVVLIGGKSRRFGQDKVLAQVRTKRLVEHVIEVIEPLFEEVIFIGHKRDDLENLRIFEDIIPGCGPMGGIYTALSVAKTRHCFVFAADMPNLNQGFIRFMIARAADQDVIIPAWSNGIEPLHAIYNRSILPLLPPYLEKGWLKIERFLEQLTVDQIGEDRIREFGDPDTMFANINTPQDVTRVRR